MVNFAGYAEANMSNIQTSPTIEEVLTRFLAEQRVRLKHTTFRRYEDVVELLTHYLDGYGHQYLDRDESDLFDRLYNAEGEAHREFCQVFGPDKILDDTGEFLNYFMVRKVFAGKGLLKATGTVMKKLARWLADNGYATPEEARQVSEEGAKASRDLPNAERLAEILYECTKYSLPPECSEVVEDYFIVDAIADGTLRLTAFGSDHPIDLDVPPEAASLCKVGWEICLALGKEEDQWYILEVGNVYPRG